jgi:hypothetical protein
MRRPCTRCGTPFESGPTGGRPRSRCDACRSNHARIDGMKWRALRRQVLAEEPTCAVDNCLLPSSQVDHRVRWPAAVLRSTGPISRVCAVITTPARARGSTSRRDNCVRVVIRPARVGGTCEFPGEKTFRRCGRKAFALRARVVPRDVSRLPYSVAVSFSRMDACSGSSRGTTGPAAAVLAGRCWRVNYGGVEGLPTGTVTLLFSDIEGSTQLLSRLGEEYADALDGQRRVLREAWSGHGGIELGTEGDSFSWCSGQPVRRWRRLRRHSCRWSRTVGRGANGCGSGWASTPARRPSTTAHMWAWMSIEPRVSPESHTADRSSFPRRPRP